MRLRIHLPFVARPYAYFDVSQAQSVYVERYNDEHGKPVAWTVKVDGREVVRRAPVPVLFDLGYEDQCWVRAFDPYDFAATSTWDGLPGYVRCVEIAYLGRIVCLTPPATQAS